MKWTVAVPGSDLGSRPFLKYVSMDFMEALLSWKYRANLYSYALENGASWLYCLLRMCANMNVWLILPASNSGGR